jgi:hypothetical protein
MMTHPTKRTSSQTHWVHNFPFLSRSWAPGWPATRGPLRGSKLIALRCRLRRNEIDRELAAGADPDTSDCRDLRASQLTSETNRQALAAAYERHVKAATSFPPLDMLPVNWRGVRAAEPHLERLAQRLRDDPGLRVQGVARARLLMTDRDGPLYASDDGSGLVDEVRSTLALL